MAREQGTESGVGESDADRFEAVLKELVSTVREAIEKRKNMGDHRQRKRLEAALEAYTVLVEELYGSERE